MAQGKSSINVFNEGMSNDIDILNQSASSYRDSMNGRMLFNKDGTYSWEPENGTKTSFLLKPNDGLDNREYKIIGNTGNNNIRVIFSTHDSATPATSNSEIGIFSINEEGIGSYKTLFNDLNDPNGDLFDFNTYNQIEARFVYENPKIIRVYWVDGINIDSNRPRVITFSFDENNAIPIGNQSDVNAYVNTNLSVFSMNSQADFRMGLIKYVGNIGGGLLSGAYQYTYSLGTKEGYWTPWYPPTRRVLVIPDQVSSTNWNEYEMGSSGITTSKGNLIKIKGVDQRFDKIRVAYSLLYTSSTIVNSKIFHQGDIEGEEMDIPHVGNVGEPLLTTEIADLFSGILGAKTLNIKDATLYYGNIKENLLQDFDIEPILENLTITPRLKDMRSDEWADTSTFSQERPVTHGWPRTGITQLKQHADAGGVEDYSIQNDYLNYKGTQIDHLYPGYFRGETYRFAIVFYDKLGFESFAFHLGDFRFPQQSMSDYEWTRIDENGDLIHSGILQLPGGENCWPTNNFNDADLANDKVFVGDDGGNLAPMNSINPSEGVNSSGAPSGQKRAISHLRIMGLSFSGINVESIAPFISGFKIVRTRRDATILLQGLLLPQVGTTLNEDGPITMPLPSTHQNFYDHQNASAPSSFSDPSASFNGVTLIGNLSYSGEGTNDEDRLFARPNASVMYAPAVNFGTIVLPSIQSEDRVTLVGGCWGEYRNETLSYKATWEMMWYQKAYYSKNPWHYGAPNNEAQYSNVPFPAYMSYMEGIGRIDPLDPRGFIEDWGGSVRANCDVRAQGGSVGEERRAHGMFNTLFFSHGNFIPIRTDPAGGPNQFSWACFYKNIEAPRERDDRSQPNGQSLFMGGFIANWIRPNANPYGGLTLTALEQSIFYGTGHFQPINNVTFDNQGIPSDFIFDDIEVFGGDCFLDYISFCRMYPHHQVGEENDDYSDARCIPWENEYNHPLREALSAGGVGGSTDSLQWANVGTRPWEARESQGASQWGLGLFSGDATEDGGPDGVFEQFDINGVLNSQELIVFYNTKPVDFLANDIFPVRWRYSPVKLYGDPTDTWRLFQVNDFRDLNGAYGEITSSIYIFNQIYSWQIGAFGRLRASDRALLESQQGGTLSTGIGDKLDGIDYVSTEFGNQHQWSLFSSDKAAYWIDVNKRKIIRFAQDGQNPISDLKGTHAFLENELPLYEDYDSPVDNRGIHGTFDFGNNDAVFTFNRDRTIYNIDSVDTPITLISRSHLGKTVTPYIIEQNQTAVISFNKVGGRVNLPVGNLTNSINENTIMYLFSENTWFSADVYNLTNTGSTLLFKLIPGSFYRLFRHSINDPWMYEEVKADDVTPYKSSLTFNEYGNWFVSYHSFAPTHYMSIKHLVVSQDSITNRIDSKNNVQIHDLGKTGDFISFSKKSYISVSSNAEPMNSKTFDSLRLNCNEDYSNYISKLLMETETQFHFIDMLSDSRKKYVEDVLRVPLRTETQDDRIRGKHILMTFEMKNNFNYKGRLTNLVTSFRDSHRT